MGSLESLPAVSVSVCQCKKDISKSMRAKKGLVPELLGVPEFVISNEALNSVVGTDILKPARQSEADYQERIRNKIAALFASAPNQLSIIHLTNNNNNETIALLRIESAIKTKEVTVSILKPRRTNTILDDANDIDNFNQIGKQLIIPQTQASELLIQNVCKILRSQYLKKRIRCETSEYDETIFQKCGFRRLKTQDAEKVYMKGHPKRVVSMEMKLTRWNDVGYCFKLIWLIQHKRAFSVDLQELVLNTQVNDNNFQENGLSTSNDQLRLYCFQRLIVAAAEKGGFFKEFIFNVLLFVHN